MAWAPDRLTRHLKELETLIATAEAAGCQLVTLQAGDWDLTTPEGRFMARQLGLLARLEAEKIAGRVQRKRRSEAEEGLPAYGGRRSWGYERDNVTVVLAEAEEIRQAAGTCSPARAWCRSRGGLAGSPGPCAGPCGRQGWSASGATEAS